MSPCHLSSALTDAVDVQLPAASHYHVATGPQSSMPTWGSGEAAMVQDCSQPCVPGFAPTAPSARYMPSTEPDAFFHRLPISSESQSLGFVPMIAEANLMAISQPPMSGLQGSPDVTQPSLETVMLSESDGPVLRDTPAESAPVANDPVFQAPSVAED
jgi:hypothetical protein